MKGLGFWFQWVVHSLMEAVSSRTERWVPRAYLFGGEFGEPSLDEVHRGRVGGCEMEREAGVALHPALYGLCFVGGCVVQYDVDVEFWGNFAVDEVEEASEFLGAVAPCRGGDDPAAGGVERGAGVGGPVAAVGCG